MTDRAAMLARLAAWLEGEGPDGEPCREVLFERGVSARQGEAFTVYLHDTGGWCQEVDRWEDGDRDTEPSTEWWSAWGAGLTFDEALAAALADLDRPDWGRAP